MDHLFQNGADKVDICYISEVGFILKTPNDKEMFISVECFNFMQNIQKEDVNYQLVKKD